MNNYMPQIDNLGERDKLLEMCNSLRLNQEETEDMNRPTITKFESVV